MSNEPRDPNEPMFPGNEEEPEEMDAEAPEDAEDGEGDAEGEETPPAAASSEQPSGATVSRIREDEDFPTLVARVYTERGTKTTGDSYAGHLRRFLTWCATAGIDTKTMPSDTAVKYLEESYPNPVTRAQANVALRSAFAVGEQHGVQFAKQEIPKPVRPPRKKPAEQPAAAHPAQGGGLFDNAPPVEERHAQPAGEPAAPAQPAPTPRVSQPRSSPGIPKGRTGIPPLGNRIRISKRSDGTDGYSPGTVILVGVYSSQDLEGEGSIEEFLANRVRPIYGPAAGARMPATYYVDRLDNLGNPIPNATIQVPVMPPLTDPHAAPAGQAFPPPPQINAQPQPSAAGGATFDMFLNYLMRRQEEAEKKYEALLHQMQQTAQQKGVDPMQFMLLAQTLKPQPLDIGKAAEEWKRANPDQQVKWGRRKTDREGGEREEDLFGPQMRVPRDTFPMTATQGALAGFEAGHHERDSVITEALRQQTEILKTLLERQGSQANQQQSPRDLFEMFATFSRAMQPQPQSNPLMEQLAQMALSNLSKPAEPAKGVRDLIAELRELRDAQELLGGGEDKPLGVGDAIMAAIEHAPQIGEAVGMILSSMPRAPTLPKPVAVPVPVRGGGTNGSNGHTKPAPAAPMPVEAQQAFVALQTDADEQTIVNHLFTILTAYTAVNAEPWPRAAKLIVRDFERATTRAEIRTVVTNLYVWSGAKRLMTEEIIDRITGVLVNHYSLIYAQLTGGGQKNLADSAEPVATPTQTSPLRPDVLDHHASAADEPTAGEVTGEEIEYEDESGPTMTMPIGGTGNPSGAGGPGGLFQP